MSLPLLRRQGARHSLHNILAASGAPRGSLYFHFPKGKGQIGEAALGLAAEAVRGAIAAAAATSDTAEDFVLRILRGMAADLVNSNFEDGCPIATTALETAAQSEVLGAATRNAFQAWEREIKRGLQRFGLASAQADVLATTLLSQLEGALLLARTYKTLAPMLRAEAAVKLLLRSPPS
jgi:AcrR family transcriptional regulator